MKKRQVKVPFGEVTRPQLLSDILCLDPVEVVGEGENRRIRDNRGVAMQCADGMQHPGLTAD